MTTPVWVPILVGGLGMSGTVVGTLGGVLITQRRSDDRERAAWGRERRRERERWAREDEARTFEARRQAYVDFYGELRAGTLLVYNHGMGLAPNDELLLADGWQLPAYESLLRLEIYAIPATARAASAAYSAMWWWGHRSQFARDDDEFYELQERVDETSAELLAAIRRDLRVPDFPDAAGE